MPFLSKFSMLARFSVHWFVHNGLQQSSIFSWAYILTSCFFASYSSVLWLLLSLKSFYEDCLICAPIFYIPSLRIYRFWRCCYDGCYDKYYEIKTIDLYARYLMWYLFLFRMSGRVPQPLLAQPRFEHLLCDYDNNNEFSDGWINESVKFYQTETLYEFFQAALM